VTNTEGERGYTYTATYTYPPYYAVETAAPGGTSLSPAPATLTLAGVAPQLQEKTAPTIATLVITGVAPQLRTGVSPTAATLTLSGQIPSAIVGTVLSPTAATLTLTGQTPSATVGTVLQPAAVAITLTGASSTLGESLAPAIATLTITGQTPTISVAGGDVVVSPAAATLTLSGNPPNVVNSTTFTPVTVGAGQRTFRLRRNVAFDPKLVIPPPARLTLTGLYPLVRATANMTVTPRIAELELFGWEPLAMTDAVMRDAERELEEEALLLGIGDLTAV
jgi:hypothetical protein